MLLRVKIKNYLSFYEETSFDMFPNPKRESFPSHVYSDLEIPVLKIAAIYGGNGSGKSNFISAMELLKTITTKDKWVNKFSINDNKFRLTNSENTDPILLAVEFSVEKKHFIYEVTINTTGIDERLLISGLGKKNDEVVFEKTGSRLMSKHSNSNKELLNASIKLLKENPFASILALEEIFPFFKDAKFVKLAAKWFKENLFVLTLGSYIPNLIEMLSKSEKLLGFCNDAIAKIGLGIEHISIDKKNLNEFLNSDDITVKIFRDKFIDQGNDSKGFAALKNNKNIFSFTKDSDGNDIVKSIIFEHLGINGFKTKLSFESQSEGTARILNLLPAFFDLTNNEDVYIIDEIENSIHPALMINLMKFFGQAKTKGQLIFTTHESNLLNQQEILRPDEVWFTEKENGATKMYSLNDFKIHNTINIRNGYLEGRYGAIPFIGDLSTLIDNE